MGRHNKKIRFPDHVLEIKKQLEESGDSRLKTMKKLTEPRDQGDQNELNKYAGMWIKLLKEESKYGGSEDNRWVCRFLDDVIKTTNLPKHAYISGLERKELIESIKLHTEKLKYLYEDCGVRIPKIKNEFFFHGFFIQEKTEEGFKQIVPEATVGEVLDFFAETAEEEICEYSHKDKKGENFEAIRFIRLLAQNNKERYLAPLNSVIKTAAFAIYNVDYSDSDISNIINKRPPTKTFKLIEGEK